MLCDPPIPSINAFVKNIIMFQFQRNLEDSGILIFTLTQTIEW